MRSLSDCALAAGSLGAGGMIAAGVAAVASYAAAVCWLYESPRAGKALMLVVAGAAFVSAWQLLPAAAGSDATASVDAVQVIGLATSGLLLGATTAAMLLGHWYLNSPGMQLAPLERLIALIATAVVLQAVVSGSSWLGLRDAESGPALDGATWSMLAIRWGFGIVGIGALAWMAKKTLEIPNTQSATGILYVAVIGAFTGEVMSLLLAAEHVYPL